MKTIKNIAKEFLYRLDREMYIYKENNSKNWKTYIAISGFTKAGDSISLYFMEHKGSKSKKIEICSFTENPEAYLKILKDIEPNQEVTYTIKS